MERNNRVKICELMTIEQ